jgi:Sec-independent protein translocase protein TatA
MLRYMLIGFAIYFGYRFLFEFLLPVIKTTRQVKRQFDAVKEQQQEFFRQQSRQQQAQPETQKKSNAPTDDDYIDFEEIK